MTRILIIGNSHTAALKHGWDDLAPTARDDLSVSFFVASSPVFAKLGFDGMTFGDIDGGLAPAQTDHLLQINGATRIDLEGFDHVLLAGMGWPGTEEIIPFLTSFAVDGLYEAAHSQRLTQRGFDALLRGAFSRTAPDPRWAERLGGRLTLMLRPMPSEQLRHIKPAAVAQRGYWAQARINLDLMRPLLDRQAELARDYYDGIGLRLLPQPDETRIPCGLTKAIYDMPARSEGGPVDIGHKNAAYGRLCLTQFLDLVAPAAGSA